MPVEPPPTPWGLQPAPADHPHDLWTLGGDLEPGTLLAGYRCGLFPMPVETELGWWSPADRGILPLDRFMPSRSLRRSQRHFEIRVDATFEAVVRACADPGREHGWIDDGIVDAYCRLHRLGWAHSIEAWDGDGLAGGLYGVAIGGLFAAESKFHRRTDASKVALCALVDLMRAAPAAERRILDVQWVTPHLASLGAVAIARADYLRRLGPALECGGIFKEGSLSGDP
jgi:leucyl/phenylalanyl-tRNA---protein transferase